MDHEMDELPHWQLIDTLFVHNVKKKKYQQGTQI